MSERPLDLSHDRIWYLKKGSQSAGPYSAVQVRHFLVEGKLTLEDEVSQDRIGWQPMHRVPEVVPMEMRQPHGINAVGDEQPDDVAKPGVLVPALVSIGLLLLIAVVSVVTSQREREQAPDCGAAPAPGINWDNCVRSGLNAEEADLSGMRGVNAVLRNMRLSGARLDNADLRYADLLQSDLSHASLRSAVLKGANLQAVDLSYASLSQADLRYANLLDANLGAVLLDGTRLDGAVWIDGRKCADGSLGECR